MNRVIIQKEFIFGFAGAIALIIAIGLILQPSYSGKDIQIIENRQSGSSCQEIICLNDVNIDNPPTIQDKQILIYNSTDSKFHNGFQTDKFERVCQIIITGTSTSLNCIASKEYKTYFVVISGNITSSTFRPALRFDFPNDSGNNYSYQSSTNLGAYNTGTDQTSCALVPTSTLNSGDRFIAYFWMNNEPLQRKLAIGKMIYGADTSDSTLQTSIDFTCKWNNTTGPSFGFSQISVIRTSGTGTFGKNSIITTWGYSP
jgi:hypothetical protein